MTRSTEYAKRRSGETRGSHRDFCFHRKTDMTPSVVPVDAPMDLSTKTRRKLRLEEFLRQNLDQAPATRVIQWVDREQGIFRILWTHQSSGAFTQQDAALFRYWALARGKNTCLGTFFIYTFNTGRYKSRWYHAYFLVLSTKISFSLCPSCDAIRRILPFSAFSSFSAW